MADGYKYIVRYAYLAMEDQERISQETHFIHFYKESNTEKRKRKNHDCTNAELFINLQTRNYKQ